MYDSTAKVEVFFYKLLAHILAHMFGCVYVFFISTQDFQMR